MTQLELVQPPAKDTQGWCLLAAFQRGEKLSVATALTQYGIYALSQRVGELKRSGWPIRSELIKVPSGKHVSVYWMDR